MKITVKLYASLSDYLPTEAARRTNAVEFDARDGLTVAALVEDLRLPPKLCHLVLVDGVFVPLSSRSGRVLRDRETVAIWPQIAGG